MKYAASGTEQWVQRAGPGTDRYEFRTVDVDGAGSVYVAGAAAVTEQLPGAGDERQQPQAHQGPEDLRGHEVYGLALGEYLVQP